VLLGICWLSVKKKNSGALAVLATVKNTAETKMLRVVNIRSQVGH